MGSIVRPASTDYDVIIIGAGISGINSAYRVQTELAGYSYRILESRGAIGGTWDLFRYPGIRSDSDLQTFGFPWRPWTKSQSIADGSSIRNYITESAEMYGIQKNIDFYHKVRAADWSSDEQQWTLTVEGDGLQKAYKARFIVWSTGYYDYEEPLQAEIPGLENYKGTRIHPQFWPEDLDYSNKQIVIIGSGATAITLLPVLAERAARVTMLQRSPTYIMNRPAVDGMTYTLNKFLPTWLVSRLARWKFLVLPFLWFKFCRAYPEVARKAIRIRTKRELPSSMPHDPNFSPKYDPWTQRLCICPDGDFFKAIRAGKADVITDTIAQVTETGVQTSNGRVIDADILVTATGLKMLMAGGASISVDGAHINIHDKFLWKSTMLQDVPNMYIVMGYTNASWTLGADAAAQLICRIVKDTKKKNVSSAVPKIDSREGVQSRSPLNLDSTYIEKAKGYLPKAGDRGNWLPRSNYLTDIWRASYGNLKGLQWYTPDLASKKII